MVHEEWLCTGRVPAQIFGTRGQDPREVWISVAAVGGKETHDALRAVTVDLGCNGGGATGGTNAVLHNRIGGQEGATAPFGELRAGRNGCAANTALRDDDGDSSRLSSGDWGNWPRRNSMKRRERGRPLVRSKPMR